MKQLNRLLIANRGEIAVRIARSARRLGITTIAICSDADRSSPHVAACDEVVPLGGRRPAESYLDAARILAAARACGAQAIHPGYGFLAESAAFAAAVDAAGLIFVGPPSAAIAAMGDKARARRRMAGAGVPVVPGYDDDAQDEDSLVRAAARIGFPIMVKAAAGGGGRGMRLVAQAAALPEALRSASSEALKAFGDGRLILERAIAAPRHVEIQLLADAAGHVVHLGERDCSVQRRHQKIVEETPSPAVDAGLRDRMGQAAIRVVHELGYTGAGTVEFLLERSGAFHFMEMNTRLQVEHPVTELVTGLDLVELQLRIARGEDLPLTQRDVRRQGHAIEVRLCAEEPGDAFLPRSGTVLDWRPGPQVRCDHALATGLEVSPHYDSMLAKLVAHGATRAEALERLADALDRTVLLGVASNRAFLARLLRHPSFVDGTTVSTGFIGQHYAQDADRVVSPDAATWALAAWLSVAAAPEAGADSSHAWRHWTNGRALPVPWRLEWQAPPSLRDAGSCLREGHACLSPASADIESAHGRARIQGVPAAPARDGQLVIDDVAVDYRYAWQDSMLWLHTRAGDYAFECQRRRARRAPGASAAGPQELRAAMNGRVVEIRAAPSAPVEAGEILLVLEAMKMEHPLPAPRGGRIAAVAVQVGEQVSTGQVLLVYERGS